MSMMKEKEEREQKVLKGSNYDNGPSNLKSQGGICEDRKFNK